MSRMEPSTIILIIGVILVVLYDFTNGFHDAADMVATAIASRSITPARAISLVAFFTFLGPLLGGVAVADTIGGFVDIKGVPEMVAQGMTLSALLSVIIFNLITWKFGLPSSSSASLTSGLIGAGLYTLGNGHIHWGITELTQGEISGFMKIVIGLFFSPLAGFIVGFFVIRIMVRAMRRFTVQTKKYLVFSQYVSISWLAFSHGTNDAQKGMGIMAMLLLASGVTHELSVPLWVILLCAGSITLGTLFGGWTIIKTVGFGIYKVKLIHSIADQIGSAMIILSSSVFGAPVSTTQVVTTTLMGIGAGERPGHVRWMVAKSIIGGWLINIPACMAMGALFSFIIGKLLI